MSRARPAAAEFAVETGRGNPETQGVRWKKVTLVGVGLLGGSLGLDLRRRRLASSVVGYVRRPASIKECERAGAVDQATTELGQAVEGAELIVLCTPLAQMLPLTRQLLPFLKKGALVTDVGSVKASVVRELEMPVARAGGHFIGSHPMAGAEKNGVAAAREGLFADAVCVVTPTRKSNRAALRETEALWKAVGARVLRLNPAAHDGLVSRSSHLPHVLAAELANLVLSPGHPKEQALLCANGFRDTTRIASGSPEMWRDIALANRPNLSSALQLFIRELQRFNRLLRRGDRQGVTRFFEQAKARRDKWAQRAGSLSPE